MRLMMMIPNQRGVDHLDDLFVIHWLKWIQLEYRWFRSWMLLKFNQIKEVWSSLIIWNWGSVNLSLLVRSDEEGRRKQSRNRNKQIYFAERLLNIEKLSHSVRERERERERDRERERERERERGGRMDQDLYCSAVACFLCLTITIVPKSGRRRKSRVPHVKFILCFCYILSSMKRQGKHDLKGAVKNHFLLYAPHELAENDKTRF